MGKVVSLRCKECKREYEPELRYFCEECFGPLEAVYAYDEIALSPEVFVDRVKTLWRYFELLPASDPEKVVDVGAGYTPLRSCDRLGEELGVKRLLVKDDTVNPTGSFKDRPASVAVTKAVEFGFEAIACPSTGNLAAAIAAHAAKAGLKCYILVPRDIEPEKIVQSATHGANVVSVNGTYDEVNRLAAVAMDRFGWACANINLRPYYVEGSKSIVFETCEQLGWNAPDHVIVPTASGGLLYATRKALNELVAVGLLDSFDTRLICAQPEGCSPIVDAFKRGSEIIEPVEHPKTIAKSLAIGDPGDGIYALRAVRQTRGTAEAAGDDEIVVAMRQLASKEGIFAEPAGAVTIAVLKKLIDDGFVSPDESIVCFVTGSGLKATELALRWARRAVKIEPDLSQLEEILAKWPG